MADFPGLKLTDAGRELQAKAQTGQRLVFTRVGLGDGAAPESLGPLTTLINERQSLSIQHQEAPGDGTATLRVILTNEGLETGFFMREMGVYAEDPDTQEEILYSYTNAGEHPDFLPASGGATLVEQIFNLVTIVGDAENVTAKIDDYITIALKSEVDALAPYVLPKAGNVGQMVRKASNAEGDTEWFDPELDNFDVRLTSIEEPRTAVANQRTFTLQKTLTNGLAVYINGERISRERWAAISATQLQLNDALEAGTRVLFVNNEEAGPGRALNVSLNGPTLVFPGQSNTYTLSDYDAFAVYTLTTTVGTVSRDGATITLTVPSEATDETLDLSVTRDNVRAVFRVAVGDAAIATPEITYPANAATGVDFEPDLSATSFLAYPDEYDSHVNTQWQVATDSGFTNIVFDSGDDTASLNAINLGAQGIRLESATRYYVRVRYKGATLTSEWSDVIYFNTALIYVRQPRITAPQDGEAGIVEQPTFQSDAFSVYGASDTQVAADWRLLDASGNTVWESLNDAENLTSITPPKGVLQPGEITYQIKVRYHGAEYGSSEWSPAITFVTAASFVFAGGLAYVSSDSPFLEVVDDTLGGTVTSAIQYPPNFDSRAVAFSPSAKLLAVATRGAAADSQVMVYNTVTWERVFHDTYAMDHIQGIKFSPDEKYLAYISGVNNVGEFRVIKTADFPSLRTAYSSDTLIAEEIYSLAWSPDGQYLAFGHEGDPGLTVLNTSDWSVVSGTPALPMAAFAVIVQGLEFSPDGQYLAVGYDQDKCFVLIDVATWTIVSGTPDLSASYMVRELAWSPDSSQIAMHTNSTFAVYNISDWSIEYEDSNGGYGVGYSPDGNYLNP